MVSAFDPDSGTLGIGIIGMRERVFGFNGQMEVHSGMKTGTLIQARFPLNQSAAPVSNIDMLDAE
jgi:two-component system sensor histidine kinase UhpB